jgi:hypothetical protein
MAATEKHSPFQAFIEQYGHEAYGYRTCLDSFPAFLQQHFGRLHQPQQHRGTSDSPSTTTATTTTAEHRSVVYLDHAAATLYSAVQLQQVHQLLEKCVFGNPRMLLANPPPLSTITTTTTTTTMVMMHL